MIPYLEILACAIIWGSAGPLIRWSGLPTASTMSIRFVIPLLLSFSALKFIEKRPVKRMSPTMIWVSILNPIGNLLYIAAFAFTSISNVLLVLYTRPVLATILAALMLGEHVSARLWFLLSVSFSGVLLILSAHPLSLEDSDIVGMAIAFSAAFATAFIWALIKRRGYGDNTPNEILFYQHLVGGIVCCFYLPHVILTEPAGGLLIASIYGILVGFVSTSLYFRGLRTVPLSRAMPLTYMELIITVIIAVTFFKETIGWRSVVGGALIVSSALAAVLISPPARQVVPESSA